MDAALDNQFRREAESRIGQTLHGKWRLDGLLGLGGMAAVYSATHRNGWRCAVKMLHAECACNPQIQQRFMREGTLANRVDHPGVVQIIDDDVTEDGHEFLVMELLEGQPLHELASRRGKLDVDRVLRVADQLLDALAAAHEHGILHRDIKPENVFLTRDGRVKLLDFGIAGASPDSGTRSTQAGTPMGTPAFMSPEQARGRWDLVGPQSDIWGVGATMFTLLSGKTVHDAETVQELMAAVFSKPAPSLATVAPDLPREVIAVVDRALCLRMAERWPCARTMQQEVRAAYRVLIGSDVPAPPPMGEPPVSRVRALRAAPEDERVTQRVVVLRGPARRGRLGALGVVLLAVLGVVFFVFARRSPSTVGSTRAAAVAVASPSPEVAPRVPALAGVEAILPDPTPVTRTLPSRVVVVPSLSSSRTSPAASAAAPRRLDLKAIYDRRL